jgi:hypothetical protein
LHYPHEVNVTGTHVRSTTRHERAGEHVVNTPERPCLNCDAPVYAVQKGSLAQKYYATYLVNQSCTRVQASPAAVAL